MEIVIDLPKNWEKCNIRFIKERIRNGTPLPKGHGRLIDVDRIRYPNIHATPTIIEADWEID